MGLSVTSGEQDRYRSNIKQQHQWSGRMSAKHEGYIREAANQTGRMGQGSEQERLLGGGNQSNNGIYFPKSQTILYGKDLGNDKAIIIKLQCLRPGLSQSATHRI